MSDWLKTLSRKAELREHAGLRRELRPRGIDDELIDLAGNDYLGLARHPEVLSAAGDALSAFGLGATGSRLVRGSTSAHAELEAQLAGWLHTEQALVYSSGYLANLGALRALATPRALIVSDAHCHASLIDGCRLAGASAAGVETVVFEHGSVPDAARLLAAREPGRPALVVTESVFSVDGDLAPLAELHAAARRAGALLLVDDAHGLGVIGPAGAGGVVGAGIAGEPDVIVTATLSKALGGAGGVIAGPAPLVRHLVDTGRTFIYDTALPPSTAAGVAAALALARQDSRLRAELHRRAGYLRDTLADAGLDVTDPKGGIISVRAADADHALAWAAACREQGVAVGCFRPPSTPDGSSRLRLTVNVGVPRADFEWATSLIRKVRP